MCKPDGSAIVHTGTGTQPINWQPPGSEHACRLGGDADGDGRVSDADTDGDGRDSDAGTHHEDRTGDADTDDESVGVDGDGDDVLVVESRRSAPEESLVVRF